MKKFLNQITPFILAAFLLCAFVFGMILLVYIIIISMAVGLILYLISWIRHKLFPPKSPEKSKIKDKPGRIIDSDEWHHLD